MQVNLKTPVSRILNAVKLLSIEILIVLAAFIGSALLVVFLVDEVFIDKEFTLDDITIQWVQSIITPERTAFFSMFTLFGSHYFLVPGYLLLIAYAFFVVRNKWLGIKVSAVAVSSLLLMFSLKFIFNRTRPLEPLIEQVPGLSFPSGHAFMSFSFFGLLIYFVYKEMKSKVWRYIIVAFSLFMILIIGFSRIYLNVHYASDVMAGMALGLMWLVIALYVLHLIEKKKTALPDVSGTEPIL